MQTGSSCGIIQSSEMLACQEMVSSWSNWQTVTRINPPTKRHCLAQSLTSQSLTSHYAKFARPLCVHVHAWNWDCLKPGTRPSALQWSHSLSLVKLSKSIALVYASSNVSLCWRFLGLMTIPRGYDVQLSFLLMNTIQVTTSTILIVKTILVKRK